MILLVSAVREELGSLAGEPLGVGAVVAAARAAWLLADRRPRGVVFVGTGSAYAGGPAPGTAVAARRVGLSAGVAAMGLGYVPRPPPPLPCDARLLARVAAPRVDVLTVGAVTTDPVLAERLADGWQLEHTEVFGVAVACAQVGVPFLAVLGVASRAGPEAHLQWLAHGREAREAARVAVGGVLSGVEEG